MADPDNSLGRTVPTNSTGDPGGGILDPSAADTYTNTLCTNPSELFSDYCSACKTGSGGLDITPGVGGGNVAALRRRVRKLERRVDNLSSGDGADAVTVCLFQALLEADASAKDRKIRDALRALGVEVEHDD